MNPHKDTAVCSKSEEEDYANTIESLNPPLSSQDCGLSSLYPRHMWVINSDTFTP